MKGKLSKEKYIESHAQISHYIKEEKCNYVDTASSTFSVKHLLSHITLGPQGLFDWGSYIYRVSRCEICLLRLLPLQFGTYFSFSITFNNAGIQKCLDRLCPTILILFRCSSILTFSPRDPAHILGPHGHLSKKLPFFHM